MSDIGIAVTASPPPSGLVIALIGQTVSADHIREAIEHPDALTVAYNVGVLELVSISLTLLTVVIAIGAVTGFWMIRGAALREARITAMKEAQSWVEREGRQLFEDAARVQGAPRAKNSPEVSITREEEKKVTEEATELEG